jgi:dTDP-4-amino-4,6-dideoxygalactose transaminase
MSKLALFGGVPIVRKDVSSKPLITKKLKKKVLKQIESGILSAFVGSPAGNWKKELAFKSALLKNYLNGNSKSILGGKNVLNFEANLAKKLNAKYCISCNSATSALQMALMSLNLDPGEFVAMSPFSFTASFGSVLAANLSPLFVDVDLDTYCLSAESLNNIPNKIAKALMLIHWNSNAGDLKDLLKIAKLKNLKVIEDASQAIFSKYNENYLGKFGECGVFSFNQPKNFSCGEGGVIITNNKDIAIKCRRIRNHGEALVNNNEKGLSLVNNIGMNYRLTELQAIIANEQINSKKFLNLRRKENYLYLKKELINNFGDFIKLQKITNSEYIPYTVGMRFNESKCGISRDIFAKALIKEGIPVSIGIPRLFDTHPMYKKKIAWGKKNFPFKNKKKLNNIKLINAKILQKEYLGLFQIGYPNQLNDIKNIIKGINKVISNKNYLANKKI